ncbi:uncharacterized protein LOC129584774 [Paramacrobiotus metropolitanus]|uniref:uncharacterized protein LOC129584774 n=1 Tax=Paramacrobiotus metropolitanus TaxID=2943436 RepID=UPI002445C728|nr:uncharacterized protein LOC129584774 [Paramacrobiotus metropolitanus]
MGDGDDFSHLWYIWCKFMFPYKPPSKGIYPYYPGCHVRNFTIQFFCYTALQHELTVNTFITGFYCDEFECVISRAPGPPGSGDNGDLLNPYKCCKTPKGYYIDYTACYYQPTHDQYGEFYDASSRHFLVFCATGYVMTGLSRKVNPWKTPDSDIDWLQCCRVAYGIKPPQPPPQANNQSVYSTPTIEMPTAYEYPPRRRSNQMAHSRFPADARSGGLSMNLEMTTNSHFQPGENTHPWMYNELPIAGEDDHRDIVTFSSDAADAVDNPHTSDDHYLEQLRNFFAPRSGGDNNPAQPLILSDDIPRIQSV